MSEILAALLYRPPRQSYSLDELGSPQFRLGNTDYCRIDFEVRSELLTNIVSRDFASSPITLLPNQDLVLHDKTSIFLIMNYLVLGHYEAET